MCCVHWKWECGRQVLPPTPSKSSWDAHASSASRTRSIFSQEEEERLNYLQPLPTRDWKAAALVKKSFQLIDFSPWQPSQPEHSHQHLPSLSLPPPPFAITFSSFPPVFFRYRKNLPSSIWKCVRCVPSYCSTRYVHVMYMYVYTAHTQDGLADPLSICTEEEEWREMEQKLPPLFPISICTLVKCENAKMGTWIDRRSFLRPFPFVSCCGNPE